MIDKETATARGVTVLDKSTVLQDDTTQRIEALKRILPACINSDNQLNTQALQDILNIANTTSNNKGYELTFAGKGIARAMASTETTKELKTEQAQSKHFDTTGNIVLRGDNIDALKILYKNYYGKIKMIYIDPPYNTQSDAFVYNDNFKQSEEALIEAYGLGEETTNFLHNVYGTKSHSGWLAFMYPRLTLARDLLTDDGVIFISIDDNEQANLKILCDELFGEDNFVGHISWESKTKSQNTKDAYQKLQPKTEMIFVYFKDKKVLFNLIDKGQKEYPENDERGNFRYALIEQMKGTGVRGRTSLVFDIKGIMPSKGKQWELGKDKIYKYDTKGDIVIKNNKPYIKLRPDDERVDITEPFWGFFSKEIGTAESAKKELSSIINNHGFETVKPVALIKRLIFHSSTNPNDIILDFFAGSGTTGDAVMQLNAEDGGNRKYILVQWDEAIDKKKNTEAHTFCTEHNLPPVISSICIERLNRAGEKLQQEHQQKHGLDIGYKVFSLTDKPCITQDEQQVFKIANERSSTFDTLYNMLTATCKTLDTPIETIIADRLYQCDNELYLIAPVEQETLEPYKDQKINIDAYADIDLETFLNLGVATRENVTVVF